MRNHDYANRFGVGIAATMATLLLATSSGAAGSRQESTEGSGSGPAKVQNRIAEKDLTQLTLVPRAVERIGIETVRVERRVVQRTRTVGGIVMSPPGTTVDVTASHAGTVLAATATSLPRPGQSVRRGQPLLRLLALSTAELASAREVVEIAEARVEIARLQATQTPDDDAGELDAAKRALRAARDRQRLLSGGGGASTSGLEPVTVEAPVDGMVASLAVSPGQAVTSGTPLLRLIQLDPIWVRVPLYSGDVASIRRGAGASVRSLSTRPGSGRMASEIAGPPTANAASASIDLYFQLPNADRAFRPNERVFVELTLGEEAEATVVPFDAILYDFNGGTWVYEETAPGTFVRRKVGIEAVTDGLALLARGPDVGTRIVTKGAFELFGTEFGIGK